jgi:hypothetical protein
MKFSRLGLVEWRQFADVDIEMHPRITIITGANGAGKTTILKLLAQHFGWGNQFLATPQKLSNDGSRKYLTGLRKKRNSTPEAPQNAAGYISYDNGQRANILVQAAGGIQFTAQIHGQQQVTGLHINSHRPVQNYQQISSIPTNAISAEQAYSGYFTEIQSKYNNSYSQFSPTYRMKEAIISMATFGAGNQYVQKNEAIEALYITFNDILRKILPPAVGFVELSIRVPDVVLVTKTGDFVLDAASGGLMSLVDLAWQIFLFSHNKGEFVVTLDEPENHLHPSMQRNILPRLLDAFPNGQFIVTTHSPFVVSSVRESNVYVLGYREGDLGGAVEGEVDAETSSGPGRKVSSVRLDLDSKAATANEILRNVLGVPVTLPEWAEQDLAAITTKFSVASLTADGIAQLRAELSSAGLAEYYPDALKEVARRLN